VTGSARRQRNGARWHHANWPALDRQSWQEANRPGDDFDPPGCASAWTAASRDNVESAYGRFLQFLEENERLAQVERVGQRLDLEHIRLFARELAKHVAPSTVWGILQALSRAFSAMARETDRTAFHQILTRMKRRTRLSRDLRGRLIDPVTLVEIANTMMDEADARMLGAKAAVLYRNGAIIMGAAVCPLRRDAWSRMTIGRHLRLVGDRCWVTFEAGELKATKRPFEAELPTEFAVRLGRYVTHHRPRLLSGRQDHGALWLTWEGLPLRGKSLSLAAAQSLRKRGGKEFSFHMFRHSAATFIENEAPDRSLMAAAVLHHADFRTTKKHYIQGQRIAAMKSYQRCVRRIVRQACPSRRKTRRCPTSARVRQTQRLEEGGISGSS
jgi:integrase